MINPCETPGMRIRSRGMGRGLARGRGFGPVGTPYAYDRFGRSLGKPNFNSGENPLRGYKGYKNPLR